LHPLESAAFSRRTPKADIWLAVAAAGTDICLSINSFAFTATLSDRHV